MSAQAIAARITRTKTPRKGRRAKTCAQLKAEEDRLRKRREAMETANAGKRAEAERKVKDRQKREHERMEARHKKELDALVARYGCTPKPAKPRKRREKKATPVRAEAESSGLPAKKASRKRSSKRKPEGQGEMFAGPPGRRRRATPAADQRPVNLTPHTVVVLEGPQRGTYPPPPPDKVARVVGLPMGKVVGLPAPTPGVVFIVSVVVAEREAFRTDLVVPGDQLRDDAGAVIGARSLVAPELASPALAQLRFILSWKFQVAARDAGFFTTEASKKDYSERLGRLRNRLELQGIFPRTHHLVEALLGVFSPDRLVEVLLAAHPLKLTRGEAAKLARHQRRWYGLGLGGQPRRAANQRK